MGRFLNADALVSTGQGVLGNNMFAYCRNNPIVQEDATGTADRACIYAEGRMDEEPWRDHSPGGGGIPRRNYGSYSNYYGEVADKFYAVKFFRAVGNGLEDLWNAYVHSNELQVQQQYQQDMMVIDVANFLTENPLTAIDVATGVVGTGLTYVGLAAAIAGITIPVGGQIIMGVIGTVCGVWGMCRIGVVIFEAISG